MDWDMVFSYVAREVKNGGNVAQVWQNARQLFGIKDNIPLSAVRKGVADIAARTAQQAAQLGAEYANAVRHGGHTAEQLTRLRNMAAAAQQNARYLQEANRLTNPGFLRSLAQWLRNPFVRGGAGRLGGTALAGSVGTVGLGVALLAPLVLAGLWQYYGRGDDPVQAGVQAQRERTPVGNLVGREVTYNQDGYAVFLLPQVSGGSIYVGQESVLKRTPTCRIPGGGTCSGNDAPVQYVVKAGPFKTHQEATAAWCKELAGKPLQHWAVAGDSKAPVYGGQYWIGTAPGCPAGSR